MKNPNGWSKILLGALIPLSLGSVAFVFNVGGKAEQINNLVEKQKTIEQKQEKYDINIAFINNQITEINTTLKYLGSTVSKIDRRLEVKSTSQSKPYDNN